VEVGFGVGVLVGGNVAEFVGVLVFVWVGVFTTIGVLVLVGVMDPIWLIVRINVGVRLGRLTATRVVVNVGRKIGIFVLVDNVIVREGLGNWVGSSGIVGLVVSTGLGETTTRGTGFCNSCNNSSILLSISGSLRF